MMNLVSSFLTMFLIATSVVCAAPPKGNCQCVNCKCTPEKHCGCYSEKGCHCSPQACRGSETCSCGENEDE